jgi:predicted transcriptional regulator
MEIPLTREQEETLQGIAQHEGKSVAEMLMTLAAERVKKEEQRWAELEHAIAQIDRGEWIEEEEMDQRVARMLAR